MLDLLNALTSFQPFIGPMFDQLVGPVLQWNGLISSAMGPGTIASDEFARLRNEAIKRAAAGAAKVGKVVGGKGKALAARAARATAVKGKALAARLRRRGNSPVPPPAPPATGKGECGAPRPKRGHYHPARGFGFPAPARATRPTSV